MNEFTWIHLHLISMPLNKQPPNVFVFNNSEVIPMIFARKYGNIIKKTNALRDRNNHNKKHTNTHNHRKAAVIEMCRTEKQNSSLINGLDAIARTEFKHNSNECTTKKSNLFSMHLKLRKCIRYKFFIRILAFILYPSIFRLSALIPSFKQQLKLCLCICVCTHEIRFGSTIAYELNWKRRKTKRLHTHLSNSSSHSSNTNTE